MHLLKIPVAKRWCYTISFEQVMGVGTFVHCDIHTKWSKIVKKMLQSGWHLVTTAHEGPLFALHKQGDDKHKKFLIMFGFVHHQNNGDNEQIWIWRKKNG